jgi:bifunctional DNA-binding transcriptional regulator/antitoxin component of YhaV-PrlF toxin-antitoxin module
MQEKDIKVVSSAGPYAALRLTIPAEICRKFGIVRGTTVTVRATKTGFIGVVKKA